ncbi:hypothetical protein V2J09_024262 [Rumex salicifolius]
MNPENQGNGPDPTSNIFIKRKRGRPRKDQSQISGRAANVLAVRDKTPGHTDQSHTTPGFERTNGSVDHNDDSMVGQMVTGVIEATFDAGFLLSVRVGNSDTSLRGIVFKPGHYMPVSTENDVAPHIQMINRNAVPIPTGFHTPVHGSYRRGRGRGRARSESRMAYSANGSNGNQLAVHNESSTLVGSANTMVPDVPTVIQPTNPSNIVAQAVETPPSHITVPKDGQMKQTETTQMEKGPENDNGSSTKPVSEAEGSTVKLADEVTEEVVHEVVTGNQGTLPSEETQNESAKPSDEPHITPKPMQELRASLPVTTVQAMWSDSVNHTPSVPHNFRDARAGKMTELLMGFENSSSSKPQHALNLWASIFNHQSLLRRMNPENLGNGPDSSSNILLKRKRGRPRKDQNQNISRIASIISMRNQIQGRGDNVPVPPGFATANGNHSHKENAVDHDTNDMVGQRVTGVVEATFDAGYLLSVRIGDSETSLRGIVFKPGHYVPVSSENDVAPQIQMINRNRVPFPTESHTPVHGSYRRGRGRGRGRNESRFSYSGNGSSTGNQLQIVPAVSNGVDLPVMETQPLVSQPAHLAASTGRPVNQTPNSQKKTDHGMSETHHLEGSMAKLPGGGKEDLVSAQPSDAVSPEQMQDLSPPLSVEPLQSIHSDFLKQSPSVSQNLREARAGKMTELLLGPLGPSSGTGLIDGKAGCGNGMGLGTAKGSCSLTIRGVKESCGGGAAMTPATKMMWSIQNRSSNLHSNQKRKVSDYKLQFELASQR